MRGGSTETRFKRSVAVHSRERGESSDERRKCRQGQFARFVKLDCVLVRFPAFDTSFLVRFRAFDKPVHAEFQQRAKIGHRVSEVKPADKVAQFKVLFAGDELVAANALVEFFGYVRPSDILGRLGKVRRVRERVAATKRYSRVLERIRDKPRAPHGRRPVVVLFVQFEQFSAQFFRAHTAANALVIRFFVRDHPRNTSIYKKYFFANIISRKEAKCNTHFGIFILFGTLI